MIKILVLTDFSSGYSRSLLQGMVRYSQEVKDWTFYRMPLYYRMLHGEKGVVEWARKWKADAIIAQLEDVDVDLLRDLGIPIIVQNYRDRIPGICNLTGDYTGTGRLAAEFFLDKGFRNFAFYGVGDTIWSRERAQGFREHLATRNFATSEYHEKSRGKGHWEYNPDTLGKWIDSLPKPVAILACDDHYALHVAETCKIQGVCIPEEVALLGVDNDELLCNIADPPLSSIILDVENGGYEAAKTLHRLITEKNSRTTDITVGTVQVRQRQSTQKYVAGNEYVLRVIDYLEANFTKRIGIADLLPLVPLSRRVLEKKFRENTGYSIYQFLLRLRIDEFTSRLIGTDQSVSDLAVSCGLEDYKNIARIFGRHKGMSPSRYRQLYGQHAK